MIQLLFKTYTTVSSDGLDVLVPYGFSNGNIEIEF